jgi:hypothetical protein
MNLWEGRSPLQDALLRLKTYRSHDERPDTERSLFEIVRLLVTAGALEYLEKRD